MTTELTKAAQQALEALEDARDDVETARQQAAQLIGYPRTDARHASYVAQLEKHDAAIDALRTALTQRPAAQTEREGWTDADADAARLALELECLLLDTKDTASLSRWWASANDALDLHRARLAAPQQATPEPVQPFLVRDVAALLGTSVPDVCKALVHLGLGQRSTNMEIKPEEALAVAEHIRAAAATPEPVGEPAAWRWFNSNGDQVTNWLDFKAAQKANVEEQVTEAGGRIEYAYTRPAAAPAVPEGFAQETMTSKWCWWFGDGERFQIVDTESEAHGEAQSYIDDEGEPGEERAYSIARVQHPIDALGMDWLALHVAESIAENVCCWCDDNTGAEEPSIMLSPDDSKSLGLMVATFLRRRVGVGWWTADQKTITQHTYVAGSNDAMLAAAQAKGAGHA